MVQEQKFKDLLSSTCQVSVERIVLDSESDVMRGPGSFPTGDNILSLDLFNIGIIANFVSFVKNSYVCTVQGYSFLCAKEQ